MHPKYTLKDFDFTLPSTQIATHPASPRDAARLLVPQNGDYTHKIYQNLPELLNAGDLIIINTSKVIPARLFATRPRLEGGGDIDFEILLHQPQGDARTWSAFVKNSKRLKIGYIVNLAGGVTAEVTAKPEGQVVLKFNLGVDEVFPFLEEHGEMPLPPYIARPDGAETADKNEYQTVYADKEGSVAAPTAGLHFTPELMQRLRDKNINFAEVTLHVGAGTFQPVQTEDLTEHKMHAEWGEITAEVAAQINATKAAGGRIIAVGTTSTRLLETAAAASADGKIAPWQGSTDIFMTPGFEFKVVDKLITNFHLPKSTLLMLVAAFVGFDAMHDLYKTAIAENYRFYSYGDGCLLQRAKHLN